MQVFSKVAEHRSFARAAEQLDLPRATVTSAVQQLETQLGVRLLQRTTRRVSLTEEGVSYLERCQRVLEELAEAEHLFSTRVQPQGVVRLDLPERLGRFSVIPALPEFLARHPGLQLRLSTSDRFVDPVGEGIDCVVRVGTLRDSSLVARRVGTLEQINLASCAYLERHGRPRSPDDLADHWAVNYFSSRTGRDLDWEYEQDGEVRSLKLRSRVSVSNSDAYLACCVAGLGLIQAPRDGVRELLDTGVLEEVLPRWRPQALPVSVIYAHHRHLSPRVRCFVEWVSEVLAAALARA
ncbi:transcriptional regulator [Caldimonas brevitalea]|uniref:Transcriptional regulator n=2 Tax=Caldimonas brevitalea TaxID=413882 RepID=A0A0G3BV02_9BURK|nr:transcriptional regulator [Caldimonas brevitalea]